MDTEMIKIVGQIAGIGGISIGVFLILFREVIRKKIFSKLTKKQGFKIIVLFLIFVWSIAIVGIVAWVWSGKISSPPEEDSKQPRIVEEFSIEDSYMLSFTLIAFIFTNDNKSKEMFESSMRLTIKKLNTKTRKILEKIKELNEHNFNENSSLVTELIDQIYLFYGKKAQQAYLLGHCLGGSIPAFDTEQHTALLELAIEYGTSLGLDKATIDLISNLMQSNIKNKESYMNEIQSLVLIILNELN